MDGENVLFKDIVAGFLVVQQTIDGVKNVRIVPLTMDWEGIGDDVSLEPGETVIGVIPAPPGSYELWGCKGHDCYRLGLELPGAYAPDWHEILKERK